MALSWLAVTAAFVFSPDVRGFVPIGHTPTYWPLLALLAWLVARERWDAAAIVCGLLIVGRTTMVALRAGVADRGVVPGPTRFRCGRPC